MPDDTETAIDGYLRNAEWWETIVSGEDPNDYDNLGGKRVVLV